MLLHAMMAASRANGCRRCLWSYIGTDSMKHPSLAGRRTLAGLPEATVVSVAQMVGPNCFWPRRILMLIHSTLPRSAVNGPGERAVIWFQGCDLGCRGCWNPSSHAFDPTRDRPAFEVAQAIFHATATEPIEGVTFVT